MNKKEVLIIVFACLITAVLVGFEVYLWQTGGKLPFSFSTLILFNKTKTSNSLTTSFDEIKTKEQGIAVCENNNLYAKTTKDTQQKQMGLAITDYCYAVIAGKFNDLNLCQRALDKNACQTTANEFIEMGKEIQNMTPEEKEQMENLYKNMYK